MEPTINCKEKFVTFSPLTGGCSEGLGARSDFCLKFCTVQGVRCSSSMPSTINISSYFCNDESSDDRSLFFFFSSISTLG